MPQTRLPRFQRVADVARIELTDRDREILHQVHRHRFLRSSDLLSLIGGSRQHVLRRLQLLYHHGFLERPRAQIDYFHRGGSRAIAYGLGNKGAAWLKREFNLPFHRLDWSTKNRSAGRLFLEHALFISEIMVTLELACRRHGNVRLVHEDEVTASMPHPAKRQPFKWRVTLPNRTKVGLIPDRVFALEFQGPRMAADRAYYFLEADRGTMPVVRADLTQSSFQRKLLGYEATWSQRIHHSQWGFHRFRVLTVTRSSTRLKTLAGACRQHARGQGLFVFTTKSTDVFQSLVDSASNAQRSASFLR